MVVTAIFFLEIKTFLCNSWWLTSKWEDWQMKILISIDNKRHLSHRIIWRIIFWHFEDFKYKWVNGFSNGYRNHWTPANDEQHVSSCGYPVTKFLLKNADISGQTNGICVRTCAHMQPGQRKTMGCTIMSINSNHSHKLDGIQSSALGQRVQHFRWFVSWLIQVWCHFFRFSFHTALTKMNELFSSCFGYIFIMVTSIWHHAIITNQMNIINQMKEF